MTIIGPVDGPSSPARANKRASRVSRDESTPLHVDLNLLIVFDALLRERNVTRAARRLGRTQSTVSGALSRLRVAFDDPLFVRSDAGVTPTERALALGETVSRSLADLRAAFERDATFDPSASRRTFTLEVVEEVGAVVVPALLAVLRREAPRVRLIVTRFECHDPSDALRAGDVDLSLGFVRVPGSPFDHAVVGATKMRVVGRRDHPLLARKLTLPAYVRASHVLVSPRGKPTGAVDRVLAERGLSRTDVTVVPSLATGLLAVVSSDALLTTTESVAMFVARELGLSVAKPPLEMSGRDLVMLWHRRVQHDAGHAWLRDRVMRVARG
jgi:DNA-binding transcriptional LysR family regulator